MNQREKLLVGVVAAAVILFLGNFLYGSYRKSVAKLDSDLIKAQKDFNEAELKLKMAKGAEKKLATWREQALPSGNQIRAYQLYSNWLTDLFEKDKKFKVEKVDRLTTVALPASVGTVGVGVTTKGSLSDLVELLYKFYSAPQLHQITRLELTPDAGNLKIRFQAEALILPDNKTAKFPAAGTINPFKLADVSEYRTTIDRRDIFKPYKAPSAAIVSTGPRVDPNLDDSRFAKFTGTNLGNKGLVAWIYRMNTGDTLFVSEGDSINVGTWKGKVVAVEPRAVVLEKDGKQTRVDIGGLIKDGKAVQVAPKKPAAAEPPIDDENANPDVAEPELTNA